MQGAGLRQGRRRRRFAVTESGLAATACEEGGARGVRRACRCFAASSPACSSERFAAANASACSASSSSSRLPSRSASRSSSSSRTCQKRNVNATERYRCSQREIETDAAGAACSRIRLRAVRIVHVGRRGRRVHVPCACAVCRVHVPRACVVRMCRVCVGGACAALSFFCSSPASPPAFSASPRFCCAASSSACSSATCAVSA